MSTGIASYYDRLQRWNRVARAIGYGGGAGALTVHRALADPRADGAPTVTRLHDVLLERLRQAGVPAAPRVLDAGCGLGGTMLALAAALDATCTGVTLSSVQADAANTAARRHRLESRVRASVGSYDQPPRGPFEVVVAIESLAHSRQPAVSLAAVAAVLAPGGVLVIVDDMPEEAAAGTRDLRTFKEGWDCPVLWSRGDYAGALARLGLSLVDELDLSGDCRPRPEWRVAVLTALNRGATALAPAAVKQVLSAHRGGLALERLLRRRQVGYRLLVAKKA